MVLGENSRHSHFGTTSPAMGWSPHHHKRRAKAGWAGLAGLSWGMRRCAVGDGPGAGSEKETNLALLEAELLLPEVLCGAVGQGEATERQGAACWLLRAQPPAQCGAPTPWVPISPKAGNATCGLVARLRGAGAEPASRACTGTVTVAPAE